MRSKLALLERPTCCTLWTASMSELGLNLSDGRFDSGFLGLIPNQRHRQQILFRACASFHAYLSSSLKVISQKRYGFYQTCVASVGRGLPVVSFRCLRREAPE